MDTGDLVGDAFEVLIVIAMGGMSWSVMTRLRRGHLVVPACRDPSSRAYPNGRHCGAPQPEGR